MRVILSCPCPEEREALVAALSDRLPIEVQDGAVSAAPTPEDSVWWLHGRDPGEEGAWSQILPRLRDYTASGGRVLTTGAAAGPVATALIGSGGAAAWIAPRTSSEVALLALPGEPLFRRAVGGFTLRSETPGVAFCRRGVGAESDVQVLAVDAADPQRAVLVERRLGSGRALFLGAGVEFAVGADTECSSTRAREQRARLCGDLVDYLANDAAAERSLGWPDPQVRAGALRPYRPAPESDSDGAADQAAPERGAWRSVPDVDSGDPFRFAGGRAVLHLEGAQCVRWWSLPVRWLRDVGVTAGGSPLVAVARRVRRGEVETTLSGDSVGHRLVQRIVAGVDGQATMEYRNTGPQTARLEWSGIVAPELPPPFPADALGNLVVRTRPQEIQVSLDVPGYAARLAFDATPVLATLTETSTGLTWRRAFELSPGASVSLRLVVEPAAAGVSGIAAEVVRSDDGVRLEFGDQRMDAAWRNIGARLEDCVAVFEAKRGPSMLAALGAAPDREGRFEHRPADSFWVAPAWHLLGRSDVAEAELRLQATLQAPDGSIPWSVSPVGHAESEAATWEGEPLAAVDAAVLATSGFVEGLCVWHAWRGRALADELWPGMQRALEFLRSIPVHSLARLEAAAWCAQAWQSAAALAHDLAEDGPASEWFAESERVRTQLDERFGLEVAGRYAPSVEAGEPLARLAPASLIPIALGSVPMESVPTEDAASFSASVWATDWGVRTRAADSADFASAEVGRGAVTATATAWVAAADFALGRADCGFAHWTGQLLASAPASGDLAGSFDGSEFRSLAESAGPNAKANAAVLALGVSGLLGWRPATTGQSPVLAPALPGGLDRITFSGLTVPTGGGHSARLSGAVHRGSDGALEVELRRSDDGDQPVTVELAPAFAWPCAVQSVTVDDAVADHDVESLLEAVRVRSRVTVRESVTVRFDVREDLLVRLRAVPTPEEERSGRLRVVERQETPTGVELTVIGRCGDHDLDVACFGRQLVGVDGAEIRDQNGSVRLLALTIPAAEAAEFVEDSATRGQHRIAFRFGE